MTCRKVGLIKGAYFSKGNIFLKAVFLKGYGGNHFLKTNFILPQAIQTSSSSLMTYQKEDHFIVIISVSCLLVPQIRILRYRMLHGFNIWPEVLRIKTNACVIIFFSVNIRCID
jgi:hypothetical protein